MEPVKVTVDPACTTPSYRSASSDGAALAPPTDQLIW